MAKLSERTKRVIDPEKAKIGARIAQARERAGLSQEELASKLGVSTSAVGQWERGWTMAHMDKFDLIPDILDVSREWLLTGDQREEMDRAQDFVEREVLSLMRQLQDADRVAVVRDLTKRVRERNQRRE